jgi:transcriptional regulator with XRE-family HTH domain
MKTIEEFRKEKGLTQLKMAYALDVTPSTISNWETGKFEPKVAQLRRLAELFGVRMDEIKLIEKDHLEEEMPSPGNGR